MVLALPPTSSLPDLSSCSVILHFKAVHDYFHANVEFPSPQNGLSRVNGRLLSESDLFLRQIHENGRDERGKNYRREGALRIPLLKRKFHCTFG